VFRLVTVKFMKLLFLSHRIPYPPNKGDKLRAWHLLSHLAKRFEVYLGCFIDEKRDWGYITELQQHCREVFALPLEPKWRLLASLRSLMGDEPLSHTYYRSGDMSAWVERTRASHQPQIELAFTAPMARYLDGAPPDALKIVDFVDVISVKAQQYAATSYFLSAIYSREARTLAKVERQLVKDANLSFFVSDAEAATIRSRNGPGTERVHAIENGVDNAYFDPAIEHVRPLADAGRGPRLVFTGHMNYWPNIDAASWFARDVFPSILDAYPDAKLLIVGARPPRAITRLGARPGIVVTGYVPDIRPWLASADVALAPMRIACGVQNKILEAMAMQKPVVCTSLGLEGIDATVGQHVLVADDADSTVRAILELLGDETRRNKVGIAARQRVIEHYQWDRSLAVMDKLIDKHLDRRVRQAAVAVA
jgi:polysaccharide biosynthesis protein PslH